jgi:hypothetical protein
MTALNEWTAELKKNEAPRLAPNSGRAERLAGGPDISD